MERLLLKVATSVGADQGYFTAVISTASIDREKDIVDPAGMVRALKKWVPTGKNVPLAWNHSTAPEHQIGYIDPKSARVQGTEVVVDGFIDQSTDTGAHAWRQVKMGTLGFSFGYLTTSSTPRKGGGRFLKEVDVFEVTASNTPMNNDTRVLSHKADATTEATEMDSLESVSELITDFLETEDDAQDIAAAKDILARVQALISSENSEAPDPEPDSDPDDPETAKSLRARADAVALEHATGGASLDALPREPDDAKDMHALFPDEEAKAVLNGSVKSAWTTAYMNSLPDSAFLYVAPDGIKDSDSRTVPRSNRMFPYKDANGAIDLPHLRNALARIPQSNLSQAIKDSLTAKATKLLADAQKSVDGAAQADWRAADPLRARAEALALDIASGGFSLEKSPIPAQKAPAPLDLVPLDELKERMRDEMLTALSGMDIET